jgi:hypothetical protein
MPSSVKYVQQNGILYRVFDGKLARTNQPADIKAAQAQGVWPQDATIGVPQDTDYRYTMEYGQIKKVGRADFEMQESVEAATARTKFEQKKAYDKMLADRNVLVNKYRQAITNFASAYANGSLNISPGAYQTQLNELTNARNELNGLTDASKFSIYSNGLQNFNFKYPNLKVDANPQTAPQTTTESTPQEGQKTSRVLSTIRGGKRSTSANVKPVEVKRSSEDEKMIQDFATNSGISREEAIKIIDNPRFKEFIAAGYTPEEARVNSYAAPTGDIIQKEHTGLSGTLETAKAQKEGQPPVQITDEATLAAIEAAKTPEEKQAIIDKWNMEKTQEAADKNIQFKKEADTNSDGVIDAKEAGKFQEAHAAATFNEAAKVDPNWMDPGRQKLLDEIARGTKVIGKDVQTVLDKNEEKYIQWVKQQDIADSYISKINVHINAWNTATTNEQRRAAKNQIKLISDQLKESNPNAWSTMQKTIQPQIAKIETGIKEGKKKREDEKNLNEQKKIFIDSQIKSGVSKEAAERAWWWFAEAGNLPWYTPPVNTPAAPTPPVPPPAAATNAGWATRIDMIQNGNNINRIDQWRPQQIGTQENPIKPN